MAAACFIPSLPGSSRGPSCLLWQSLSRWYASGSRPFLNSTLQIQISIRAAFSLTIPIWGVVRIFELLADILFLFDIALNFRIGWLNEDLVLGESERSSFLNRVAQSL